MTVQELIDKLNKLPKDADVMVVNSEAYDDGVYVATNVSHFDNSNIVVIGTDYEDISKKQDEIIDCQNLIIDKQSEMITELMDKSVKQEELIEKQSELIEVQQRIIDKKDKQIKLLGGVLK